jgi:DNA-binding MarR family transcriptional regulator
MHPGSQHELRILTEIAAKGDVTQRTIAKDLGIALGLTNLYMKRLVRKGFVKISGVHPHRLRYLLTPQGIVEKSRLTYEYLQFSLWLYKETRGNLAATLRPLIETGIKRYALYGLGESAELAYLTLRQVGLEPVGIFAEQGGGEFLGLPVRPTSELEDTEYDRVIAAVFMPVADGALVALQAVVPDDKLIFLEGSLVG